MRLASPVASPEKPAEACPAGGHGLGRPCVRPESEPGALALHLEEELSVLAAGAAEGGIEAETADPLAPHEHVAAVAGFDPAGRSLDDADGMQVGLAQPGGRALAVDRPHRPEDPASAPVSAIP